MSVDFHQTRMGQRFFESTLPRLVEQLERLNKNLEAHETRILEQKDHDARAAGFDSFAHMQSSRIDSAPGLGVSDPPDHSYKAD